MMIDVESYRQNAAECLRQAETEAAPEGKNILLNVALAWVRLAHQVQEVATIEPPDAVIEADYYEVMDEPAGMDDPRNRFAIELEKALVTH